MLQENMLSYIKCRVVNLGKWDTNSSHCLLDELRSVIKTNRIENNLTKELRKLRRENSFIENIYRVN